MRIIPNWKTAERLAQISSWWKRKFILEYAMPTSCLQGFSLRRGRGRRQGWSQPASTLSRALWFSSSLFAPSPECPRELACMLGWCRGSLRGSGAGTYVPNLNFKYGLSVFWGVGHLCPCWHLTHVHVN